MLEPRAIGFLFVGSAAQECVFLRAQKASLRHTAAGIPQGGGGVCGGGGEVAGWLG